MNKKTMAKIGLGLIILLFLFSGGDDDSSTSDDMENDWDQMISDEWDVDAAISMTIYESLAFQGIDDAIVEVTSDRVLIKCNQPPMESEADALLIWLYMMGVAAEAAPDTVNIVIRMYADNEPLFESTVLTDDVLAFTDSQLTVDEFRTRVNVRAMM